MVYLLRQESALQKNSEWIGVFMLYNKYNESAKSYSTL